MNKFKRLYLFFEPFLIFGSAFIYFNGSQVCNLTVQGSLKVRSQFSPVEAEDIALSDLPFRIRGGGFDPNNIYRTSGRGQFYAQSRLTGNKCSRTHVVKVETSFAISDELQISHAGVFDDYITGAVAVAALALGPMAGALALGADLVVDLVATWDKVGHKKCNAQQVCDFGDVVFRKSAPQNNGIVLSDYFVRGGQIYGGLLSSY